MTDDELDRELQTLWKRLTPPPKTDPAYKQVTAEMWWKFQHLENVPPEERLDVVIAFAASRWRFDNQQPAVPAGNVMAAESSRRCMSPCGTLPIPTHWPSPWASPSWKKTTTVRKPSTNGAQPGDRRDGRDPGQAGGQGADREAAQGCARSVNVREQVRSDQPYQQPSSRWHLAGERRGWGRSRPSGTREDLKSTGCILEVHGSVAEIAGRGRPRGEERRSGWKRRQAA